MSLDTTYTAMRKKASQMKTAGFWSWLFGSSAGDPISADDIYNWGKKRNKGWTMSDAYEKWSRLPAQQEKLKSGLFTPGSPLGGL